MKTRQTTIQANAAHTAATTHIIPIRITDPISRLLIPYGVTVGANTRLGHMSNLFSKIALVDGSDVLLSMTGPQVDGLDRLDNVGSGASFGQNTASVEDFGNLIIDFGRHLYDKELALDPTKFKNLQLQLTTTYTAVEAACTADEFAVQACIMEGLAGGPMGFLMKKEMKSWTAANGAWEYTQLPRDYKYRRLFVQALTSRYGLSAHWSRALLQEDNYKRTPFDVLVDDIVAANGRDYGLISELVSGATSNGVLQQPAAPNYGGSIIVNSTTTYAALEGDNLDGGMYVVISAAGTTDYRGVVVGFAPQGMVAFDLGPKDLIEDWYDPTQVGSLQLEVLGAGARTVRLVTEQLRTY